jgi:hypothetical protein
LQFYKTLEEFENEENLAVEIDEKKNAEKN